jgi:hypothetical protein
VQDEAGIDDDKRLAGGATNMEGEGQSKAAPVEEGK